MILTGQAIANAIENGDIEIESFEPDQLNPNSYNYRLGPEVIEVASTHPYRLGDAIKIPDAGLVLHPHRLYLAATAEIIGSRRYVTTLLGRSSVGRLGLFLNVSADLGHAGSRSRWTLELTVVQPLRVYGGMVVGQVAFWGQEGRLTPYCGRYHEDIEPQGSRDRRLQGIMP
ncbi:hypothetical protein Q9Q95_14125 [Sphingomonas sp. DG1-23]|uniref:dCTP deaminase n=1 Tax=Sphingomonas sp. DG1-23 TaxID=3068316 RepID=UPI0027401946|nr:hypothetical protein [Sphingomonas sp. DG1-23]MDP5280067.1 hypothetical protein [Sphingomonas sp. DG1-23]